MVAPTKAYTEILAATVAAGKPVLTTTGVEIADNFEHFREVVYGSYVAAADHDHDAVNSAPVFGASLPKLAETVVGSPVSSVDFTGAVDWTAYDEYLCTYKEVAHSRAAGDRLVCRFSNDAGSTFKSGASDYIFSNDHIALSQTFVGTTGRADGQFFLHPDPGLILVGQAGAIDNASSGLSSVTTPGGGWDYSFGALDGLRFFVDGYNITAGTFRIYGVKRS